MRRDGFPNKGEEAASTNSHQWGPVAETVLDRDGVASSDEGDAVMASYLRGHGRRLCDGVVPTAGLLPMSASAPLRTPVMSGKGLKSNLLEL